MKAALQHKNGDPTSPDVLSVVADAAVPEPAAGQVLVKVSCASVKPLVDARDFELTTAGVGDIVTASMTHRTKGKLVLTVSKQ